MTQARNAHDAPRRTQAGVFEAGVHSYSGPLAESFLYPTTQVGPAAWREFLHDVILRFGRHLIADAGPLGTIGYLQLLPWPDGRVQVEVSSNQSIPGCLTPHQERRLVELGWNSPPRTLAPFDPTNARGADREDGVETLADCPNYVRVWKPPIPVDDIAAATLQVIGDVFGARSSTDVWIELYSS